MGECLLLNAPQCLLPLSGEQAMFSAVSLHFSLLPIDNEANFTTACTLR